MHTNNHTKRSLLLQGVFAVALLAGAKTASAQNAPANRPTFTLLGASGTLCPEEGSVTLDSSSGALTAILSRDIDTQGAERQDGNCTIEINVDVEKGWTFIKPKFYARVTSDSELPASHVTFTYSWTGYKGEPLGETFDYPITSNFDGNSQLLTHEPNITSPTCKESTSFKLTVDLKADVQPESLLSIQAMDADFTSDLGGVRWERCPYGT